MSTTANKKQNFSGIRQIGLYIGDDKIASKMQFELRTAKKNLDNLLGKIKQDCLEKTKQLESKKIEETATVEQEQKVETITTETQKVVEEVVVQQETVETPVVEVVEKAPEKTEVLQETSPVQEVVVEEKAEEKATEEVSPIVEEPQVVQVVEKETPKEEEAKTEPQVETKVEQAVVTNVAPIEKEQPAVVEKAEKKAEKVEKKDKKSKKIEELEKQALSKKGVFVAANNRPSIDLSALKPKPVEKPNITNRFINNNTRVKREGFMSGENAGNNQGNRPYRPYNRDGQNTTNAPQRRPNLNGGKYVAPSVVPTVDTKSKKKTPEKNYEKENKMSKKTLINKGFIAVDQTDYEDRMGSKKLKVKKKTDGFADKNLIKIEKAVVNTDIIPIKVLSEKLGISAAQITKNLFKEGIIKTINESVDFDTAGFVAAELGIELELKKEKSAEEMLTEAFEDSIDSQNATNRPPVVTVMGHVDHGKTSLLDYIRKAKVVDGEAGGITQHIGAYTIQVKDRAITFIDTPGHEAFTSMRERGAQVTDIAVLVIAADDGVMPQTIESIKHCKKAKVPLIIAANKIDKVGANIERVKEQLAANEILTEDWGGDAMLVPISAKTGQGVDDLLESILLLSDVSDLKADPNALAKGTIIEARLDKGRGPVATILVTNGTLKVGDHVICGTCSGRIRAMIDDNGKNVKLATPSYAVSVLGFDEVPTAGDFMYAVEGTLSRQLIEERIAEAKQNLTKHSSAMTLEEIMKLTDESQQKILNIIIKADVQGSAEALNQALSKIENDEAKVTVVSCGVGLITETDINFAITTKSVVVGFNCKPDANAKKLADRNKVDVRNYKIIYQAIDDITDMVDKMKTPKYKENILGKAEVRNVFKLSSGVVAGSYVLDGKIVRSALVRVMRGEEVKFDGKIAALKRFKDDVKEVGKTYDCGISMENFTDIAEQDIIICYELELIK